MNLKSRIYSYQISISNELVMRLYAVLLSKITRGYSSLTFCEIHILAQEPSDFHALLASQKPLK